MDQEDELISVLPIHFSTHLAPNIHLHQFPLLSRPLQAPPSAISKGKRITARIKPVTRRLEIHVPADTRPEVWNAEKAAILGTGRLEDDREKNQESKIKKEGELPRLGEIRLRSEEIPRRGCHMLGIVRNGTIHLHPIDEIHQFRPTMTYLDVLSHKNKRSRGNGSGSDSDDGPPPDPDEPAAAPKLSKKGKKSAGEVREVQVTTRKAEDKSGLGALSVTRREMLHMMRMEEDEEWEDLEFCDITTRESEETFDGILSYSDGMLECKTSITKFITDIPGL